MHTFFQKPVKHLKMHKLTRQETGEFRNEMISLLARTPDPYSSVMYQVDIEACKEHAKTAGSAANKHITLTPVILKLVAHAIAENPVFNQMIFGARLYQFEEINIGTLTLIPGTDAVTYIIVENAHKKSLAAIQQELFSGIAEAKIRMAAPPHALISFLTNLCYRYGLFRLVGEKRAFTAGFERGLLSNISLAIHTYTTTANFTMIKDVLPAINISPRFHVCGPVRKPVFENDLLISKEILELHVTTDHRIVDGVHSYRFGQTLEQITANPDRYFY